jgi:hypothetical protein
MARVALAALEPYGFVLAGGYAVALAGIGDRLSNDVDLFTNVYSRTQFDHAKAIALGDDKEVTPLHRPALAAAMRAVRCELRAAMRVVCHAGN